MYTNYRERKSESRNGKTWEFVEVKNKDSPKRYQNLLCIATTSQPRKRKHFHVVQQINGMPFAKKSSKMIIRRMHNNTLEWNWQLKHLRAYDRPYFFVVQKPMQNCIYFEHFWVTWWQAVFDSYELRFSKSSFWKEETFSWKWIMSIIYKTKLFVISSQKVQLFFFISIGLHVYILNPKMPTL